MCLQPVLYLNFQYVNVETDFNCSSLSSFVSSVIFMIVFHDMFYDCAKKNFFFKVTCAKCIIFLQFSVLSFISKQINQTDLRPIQIFHQKHTFRE